LRFIIAFVELNIFKHSYVEWNFWVITVFFLPYQFLLRINSLYLSYFKDNEKLFLSKFQTVLAFWCNKPFKAVCGCNHNSVRVFLTMVNQKLDNHVLNKSLLISRTNNKSWAVWQGIKRKQLFNMQNLKFFPVYRIFFYCHRPKNFSLNNSNKQKQLKFLFIWWLNMKIKFSINLKRFKSSIQLKVEKLR
jgi:hypothetical protein